MPLILLLAIPPTAPDLSTVIEAPVANPCNAFVTLTIPLPSKTSILSVSSWCLNVPCIVAVTCVALVNPVILTCLPAIVRYVPLWPDTKVLALAVKVIPVPLVAAGVTVVCGSDAGGAEACYTD